MDKFNKKISKLADDFAEREFDYPSNGKEHLSKGYYHGYIDGYDQSIQYFLEKAKEFFIEQHAGMFTQFKNYMQDESD